jgi:hypothetical protein
MAGALTLSRSPLSAAIGATADAHHSAVVSRELGAAFDILVVGTLLQEDATVHETVLTRMRRSANRLAEIIEDRRVTPAEMQDIELIVSELSSTCALLQL